MPSPGTLCVESVQYVAQAEPLYLQYLSIQLLSSVFTREEEGSLLDYRNACSNSRSFREAFQAKLPSLPSIYIQANGLCKWMLIAA